MNALDTVKTKTNVLVDNAQKAKTTISTMLTGAVLMGSTILTSFADDTDGIDTNEGTSTITNIVKKLFSGVYGQITSISTITAAVLTVCALVIVAVSDEKRGSSAISWIKRIWICWLAIMFIGPIIAWFTGIVGTGTGSLVG